MDVEDVSDEIKEVLITQDQIQERIRELAAEIADDYVGREVLFVGVLKGAVMVMADLARAMPQSVVMDWMAVASYVGRQSSGVVRILKDLDGDISGKHVVLVEDIVDSGLTLSWLMRNLESRAPASLEVCAMLRKPAAAKVDVPIKYVGFDLDDEFVVGYGLDYKQRYRNLTEVATLQPHMYQKSNGKS
ncbi:MAG: hypoxanthine phosphoribosyltransferase [Actinomycetia bacterium]|nr:hypoxanthine phosphoribosyltransferase [Actinomycetes bacterium]